MKVKAFKCRKPIAFMINVANRRRERASVPFRSGNLGANSRNATAGIPYS
ncbi:MAG: hypothetical protein ACYC0V_16910 [Armatimonadota bacterium]